LLDWGVFGPEDNEMTLDDCVTKTLWRMCGALMDLRVRRDSRCVLSAVGALIVSAADDPVAPPESVHALLDRVGSDGTASLQVHGSHLSLMIGLEATWLLWPAISRWLATHDQPAAPGPVRPR
jgi:hypothetical protein